METECPEELENLLMRFQACELSLAEEQSLAERLLRDPLARRALVESFLISSEAGRVLGLRTKAAQVPARRERWNVGWIAAGVGVAAAAGLLMALNFGMPDRSGAGLPAHGQGDGRDNLKGENDPKVSAEEAAKIAALIQQLGDEEAAKRDAAEKELLALGPAAVPQLEKASKDEDVERSTRAKALVRRFQIGVVLKEADTGLFAAKDLTAELEYNMQPRNPQKGAYRQTDGGVKFKMELEPPADPNRQFTNKKTVVSDGETVWALTTFEMKGRPANSSCFKASYAFYKTKDLAWNGAFSVGIQPVQLLKLVRSGTAFSKLVEDTLDGQKVWVLEGPVPDDKRGGLTLGGIRAGGANGLMQNAPNTSGAAGGGVKNARLVIARDGGSFYSAAGLNDDGTVVWEVKLGKVKLGEKADEAAYKFTLPEGARVFDLEKPNMGMQQGGGGNGAAIGPAPK
ncbi:MAG: hypothetical protein HY291_01520 [Planctomycetes bacterium]|nr:hypothetical protein [Planctomycetota bacterium]